MSIFSSVDPSTIKGGDDANPVSYSKFIPTSSQIPEISQENLAPATLPSFETTYNLPQTTPISLNDTNIIYKKVGFQRADAVAVDHVFGSDHDKQKVRSEKIKYSEKGEADLFDSSTHVTQGPLFEKKFRDEQDTEISITGGAQPIQICSTFDECNFTDQLLKNLRRLNYTKPTQIQKATIPIIQKTKNDVLARAQTGTGKTAAFLLPLINELQQLRSTDTKVNNTSPYVIILAPTRELVRQLYEDACSFCFGTVVSVAVAIGDVEMRQSISLIRAGCDILVSTFGRLIHYMREQIIKLSNIRYFVLDEADKFLQIDDSLYGLREIRKYINEENEFEGKDCYRTMMFSATFGQEIQRIAMEFLRPGYCFVHVGGSQTSSISQTVLDLSHYDKRPKLIEILRNNSVERKLPDGATYYETEKTIVFINGRRESDWLALALTYFGFKAISINSTRTQTQRFEAEDKFTRGVYDILVATDIAARGLNFPNVTHVINYNMPRPGTFSQYIHRIGRTGRLGNTGRATTFFNKFDFSGDILHAIGLVETLKESNQEVPEFLFCIYEHQMKILRGGLEPPEQQQSVMTQDKKEQDDLDL